MRCAGVWAVTAPSGVCRLAPVRFDRPDWDAAVELEMRPVRPEPPTPEVPLTERQQQVVDFIRGYVQATGFAPTLLEIADGVGLKSRSTAAYQVGELRRLGVLAESDGRLRPRALRLVRGEA